MQLSTHSSVQLPSWGRWSTNMKRAGFCQISDEFCSVYCSFLSPLCCCHPRIVNWYHSSSYALLSLSSCARDDVMLPLVWINRRWPYADTEEWARPWLGVPALVSQNDWLLFLHPTRPNQTFTCAHTPMCNYFSRLIVIMLNGLHTSTINVELLLFWRSLPIWPVLSFSFSVNKVNTEGSCSVPRSCREQ